MVTDFVFPIYLQHICAAMTMFRKRSMRVPSPYRDRVGFMDHWLLSTFCLDYKTFNPKKFLFDDSYLTHGKGEAPADSATKKHWYTEIDDLYACVNVKDVHWIALDINFPNSKIYVYDSIPTCATDKEILEACAPFRKMIPALLNVMVPHSVRKKSVAQFAVRRMRNIPINMDPGDCGVYTLKYIECLALGWTFERLNDGNIQAIREKLGADLFEELPDERGVRMSNPLPRRSEFVVPHLNDNSV